jgi:hypothetical protein
MWPAPERASGLARRVRLNQAVMSFWVSDTASGSNICEGWANNTTATPYMRIQNQSSFAFFFIAPGCIVSSREDGLSSLGLIYVFSLQETQGKQYAGQLKAISHISLHKQKEKREKKKKERKNIV